MITRELVDELLSYDQLTGVFTWKHKDRKHFKSNSSWSQWNTRYSGKVAGSKKTDSGYIIISINKTLFRAHRLAWLLVHGTMPRHEIDHINGRRDDNSMANLRDVPKMENVKNKRLLKNNKSGYHGITKHPNGKFRVKGYMKDAQVHLGYFSSLKDAILARKDFERSHSFHINHGSLA